MLNDVLSSFTDDDDPVNTRRWPNAGSMLGQRRRRWAIIKPALNQLLVFIVHTLSSDLLTMRDRFLMQIRQVAEYCLIQDILDSHPEEWESFNEMTLPTYLWHLANPAAGSGGFLICRLWFTDCGCGYRRMMRTRSPGCSLYGSGTSPVRIDQPPWLPDPDHSQMMPLSLESHLTRGSVFYYARYTTCRRGASHRHAALVTMLQSLDGFSCRSILTVWASTWSADGGCTSRRVGEMRCFISIVALLSHLLLFKNT